MPVMSILKSCNIPAGWPLGHRDIAQQGLLKEALSEPPSTHLSKHGFTNSSLLSEIH